MTGPTMPDSGLLDQVRRTAAARNDYADLEAGYRRYVEAFKQDTAALSISIAEAKSRVLAEEGSLRAMALAAYERDPENKHPAPGVGISVKLTLDYDALEALAWARSTRMAVLPESLDAKAFEKIAKASPSSFEFVTVVPVPSATLASDLNAALLTEGVETL